MFPSTLIKTRNPLYEYERRQIGWVASTKQLKRFTVLVLAGALIFASLIALSEMGANPRVFRRSRGIFDLTLSLSNLSLVITLIVGFYYMYIAVRNISRDVNSGLWDGLRLTLLGEDNIVWAKYALIQARVWPWMVVFIAFQIVVAMLRMPFFPTFNPNFLPGGDTYGLVVISTRAVSLLQAVLEPLWTMQALTALGLMLGLTSRRQNFALLGIFLSIVGVEIVQVGIARLLTLSNSLWFSYFSPGYGYGNFSTRFVVQLITATISLLMSYAFFTLLRAAALSRAFRAAYTVEPVA